ncbi:hypothetical protein TNCV_2025091 [Trichonephila clavipes]|nr:hypothetical protein TNCV_2025091 [Trichonephila clavipes]
MEIPLRTAYGQAGRCDMQPKAKYSLRAQAQLMRTETVETVELVKLHYLPGAIFQQVDAKLRTALIPLDCLHDLDCLPRSSKSPVLSQVEYVWDIVGHSRFGYCQNMANLEQ